MRRDTLSWAPLQEEATVTRTGVTVPEAGSTTNLSATVAPLHAAVTTAHVALVATAPTSDAGPTDSHALRVFRRCGNARAEGRDAAEVFAPQNGQLASSAFTRHAHAVHATKPSIIAQA